MTSPNDTDDVIADILRRANTIAVVGLSDNPERPSYGVATVLEREGFTVIPVNPLLRTWRGRTVYPNLQSIPVPVDIVNVFRRVEHVDKIAEDAIEIHTETLWLQTGIVHEGAARKARSAGLNVVMDRCIAVDVLLLLQHRTRY